MPITGVCPSCGAKAPLEAYLAETRYLQAMVPALRMPAQLADQVLPYLALFSPATGRAIRPDRLARVVATLCDLVTSAQVTRKRITHAAPLELWRQGLEEALHARDTGSLVLPLVDHAYLSEIVWRLAAKAGGQQQRQQDAARPLHPSHRIAAPDKFGQVQTVGRLALRAQLEHLKKLYGKAPNEALAKQIADIEIGLNGGE